MNSTTPPTMASSAETPVDVKSRLKDSYDIIANDYNSWTNKHHDTIRLKFLDSLLSKLNTKEPTAVLELGCGGGKPVTTTLLTHPKMTVTANDMSSTQISIAKSNIDPGTADRVTFVEGDMMALSFPDGSLDAVLGFYSIIHLPREEQPKLLENIIKWLKPGGYLLANFSAVDMPAASIPNWLHEKGWMFWSGWGEAGTLQKLKDAKFEIVEQEVQKDTADSGVFLWVIARTPAN
ncbi:methyltransferase domain-containing protein [Microthyrium microscopicum]|uniref:Methyltransferase domain-containing protein n=1 Tax=Microthyrium microscopicum TaxID=703497 RepID=A0A6A6TVN6_9PEZI|nr:methyltransferase domain-containing protein [Microthyrium microscopicum]